jgi:hypothetical protein
VQHQSGVYKKVAANLFSEALPGVPSSIENTSGDIPSENKNGV